MEEIGSRAMSESEEEHKDRSAREERRERVGRAEEGKEEDLV